MESTVDPKSAVLKFSDGAATSLSAMSPKLREATQTLSFHKEDPGTLKENDANLSAHGSDEPVLKPLP